jgi:hypothetical protein
MSGMAADKAEGRYALRGGEDAKRRLDQQVGVVRHQRPQVQVSQVKLRGQVHPDGIVGGDRRPTRHCRAS